MTAIAAVALLTAGVVILAVGVAEVIAHCTAFVQSFVATNALAREACGCATYVAHPDRKLTFCGGTGFRENPS